MLKSMASHRIYHIFMLTRRYFACVQVGKDDNDILEVKNDVAIPIFEKCILKWPFFFMMNEGKPKKVLLHCTLDKVDLLLIDNDVVTIKSALWNIKH